MSLIKISPNGTKCSSKFPSWYFPFSYVYTHRGLNPQQWLKTLPFFQLYMKKLAQMVKRLPAVWETWVRSLGWEDPLEKEMATHSRTLAWKIPLTEQPGRLQSMGLQRVEYDWMTSLHFTSCPLSLWCHPAISSSVISFSFCLQCFPASGSFKWVSSSHQVAKVLELQHQSFQWIFRTNFL